MEYFVEETSRSGKDHYRFFFAHGARPKVGDILISKGGNKQPLFKVVKTNFKYVYVESLAKLIPKVGGVYEVLKE